ncbi:MtnX-like HAD-IB family phosphatase [bacterium]|nr:MtnX-like HAD-IB family phosphatase [bacterium]
MSKFDAIYCDFDGTITKYDAVNTFLELYTGDKWLESEKLWIEGEISSMENAIIQVGLLPEITPKQLDNYIESIEIDNTFLDFIKYAKEQNIKFTILSDGFDLFIHKTLERLGIRDIPIYANHLIYENNRFKIEFPYHNTNCDKKAGMCKCDKVKENSFCYIGDGTSDLCIAGKANVLFATKNLHKYCEKKLIKHYYFETFGSIIERLKEGV